MSKVTWEVWIADALRRGQNFTLPENMTYLNLSEQGIDYRDTELLANILRKNTTLLDLRLHNGIDLEGAQYLLDALTENVTLTRLKITLPSKQSSLRHKWDAITLRINDLIKKNTSLQQSIQHKVQEEARRQREAQVKKEREEEEAKKKQEAELNKKLLEDSQRNVEQLQKQRTLEAEKRKKEEETKQRAALKAWIDSNNWEAVAAFIKEHSDFAINSFLSAGKYNLNTVTFINQLSAHTVQRTVEELEGVQQSLETTFNGLSSQFQSLKQEEEELKKRLEQVEAKKKQIVDKAQDVKEDLDIKIGQVTKAKDNLKQIQASLAEDTPKLNQWKERLRVDVVEWTDEDIEFLLRELDMANHATTFTKNKIDGSVLLDLTTSDLIDTLSVTFKEAKRLLKSVFLARIYKDIYTTPPGVLQWHVDTVCSWLEDNKFAHLTDIFRKQQITGSELAFIDRNDLKKYLGIEALGDCIKLEKVIKQLQQSHLAVSIQKQIAIALDEKTAESQSELDQKLHQMKTVNEELKLKLKNSKRDAPKAFCCPITQEIMSDPVVANDGHTYERVAIEAWLLHHDTSPMTNQRLDNKTLTPSHTLKSMIREFVDQK